MTAVGELAQAVRSLIFPASCVTCRSPLAWKGRGDSPLCRGCFEGLPWSDPPWCRRCGRSLAGLGTGVDRCADCRQRNRLFDQAISACSYEGGAKTLIQELKYRGRLGLAPFLGRLLAQLVRERLGDDPADAVVPVPLHPTRFRDRGFNQSGLLARAVADRLHLLVLPRLLIRQKPTLPQAQLPREERLANVQGAFGVREDPLIRMGRILLVDDVFTTGATAEACAQLLKQAGAGRVFVVTFAQG
ncbi:MAG: ComF family protein [Candidatus Omnitrophica bacterium]|nr:ComF family protein [Candidatus Omnitrophota bacterium]